MPRAIISKSGPKLGRGSSSRAQFQATIAPSPAEKASVLAKCSHRLLEAAELGGEIVSTAKDGDRHSGHLEPEQSRLTRRGRRLGEEARSVDEDERGRPPRERPFEERVGELEC